VCIFKQRAPGMSLNRMPLFVWAMLVMALMIIFAMPPLMVASVFLALDRTIGTHFFNPQAFGDPLLWQHLFWWFGHPEVYIILVPALGIVSAIVTTFARRPVFGYTLIVLSTVAIGFLSFGLWVHHMFTAGLPLLGMSFFAAASMMIGIPSGVQIFAWIATMWNGKVSFKTPMLYVIGFIILFVNGGITGIMLAAVPFDWQVHDSHFVVAHFHYVILGGMVFPVLGGLHYWFPKFTGRMPSERLGKISFWLTFIGVNVTFLHMHVTGFLGMPRRAFSYVPELGWDLPNLVSTIGAYILGLGALVYVWNFVYSLRRGEPAGPNPWNADTLEWATTSPPPGYNFEVIPTVRSRHPLWHAGDSGNGHAPVVNLGDQRRELLGTKLLDADPDVTVVVAKPSIWPFLAALAVVITFIGSIIHPIVTAMGALLTFISIAAWNWPDKERREL
jgi:cytochrome c oxidase subunit I+III